MDSWSEYVVSAASMIKLSIFVSAILLSISTLSGCASAHSQTNDSRRQSRQSFSPMDLDQIHQPCQRPPNGSSRWRLPTQKSCMPSAQGDSWSDETRFPITRIVSISVTDIGGGFGELNTEAIIAQKPDLVLASSLTPPEQIKALESLGLTVFAWQIPVISPGCSTTCARSPS